MPKATTAFHNRIVLAFDFDETLAPPTTPKVLEYCGYDPDDFYESHVRNLVENEAWEKQLAGTYAMVEALKRDGKTLTESDLAEIGRGFPLFGGVEEMFDHVRRSARAIVEDIDVRFYLITAGFAEVVKHTAIADEFDYIYGGAFHFDEDGNLATAKRIINHAEKTRYLLQIAKGLELDYANPQNVYRPQEDSKWLAPVDQMIYVGDGSRDLPTFHFMHERGGMAMGIDSGDSPEEWAQREKVQKQRRVEKRAANIFEEDSELLQSIVLAVERPPPSNDNGGGRDFLAPVNLSIRQDIAKYRLLLSSRSFDYLSLQFQRAGYLPKPVRLQLHPAILEIQHLCTHSFPMTASHLAP